MLSFRHIKQTSKNVVDTTFNDLPDNIICDIVIYVDDTTFYSKCEEGSNLWQQLELVSELESDLQGTIDWGMKRLVDSNVSKTQLASFDRSGLIHLKIDGSVLEEKSSFMMLKLSFFCKLDLGSYISSVAKTASIRALIRSVKFSFFLKLLFMSKNLPYNLAWNTAAMPGPMLVTATWICYSGYISYRNGCVRLLVFHLLA